MIIEVDDVQEEDYVVDGGEVFVEGGLEELIHLMHRHAHVLRIEVHIQCLFVCT